MNMSALRRYLGAASVMLDASKPLISQIGQRGFLQYLEAMVNPYFCIPFSVLETGVKAILYPIEISHPHETTVRSCVWDFEHLSILKPGVASRPHCEAAFPRACSKRITRREP